MRLFVDTEFTDFIDCELISIGLVSEDGRHEFYAEVADYDRQKCNAHVQAGIWPLLGKTPINWASSAARDSVHHEG